MSDVSEVMWKNYINGIASNASGANIQNIIAVAGNIVCALSDENQDKINNQLFELGVTIPKWNISWNGATDRNLYNRYELFLEHLKAKPSTENPAKFDELDKQIDEIRSKMKNYNSEKILYTKWLNKVCSDLNQDGSCRVYYPSNKHPNGDAASIGFEDWKTQNISKPDVRDVLKRADEFQSQLNDLLDKRNGKGFAALQNSKNNFNSASDYYGKPLSVPKDNWTIPKVLETKYQLNAFKFH